MSDSSKSQFHFQRADKRDLIGHILEHRYEVEDFIGEGAMGYVYKGRQIRLKRPVAIKVPRPEFTSNSEFMARFEREALAMAKCIHENIVAIYDVYVSRTPGEISYIAMELVQGPELDDFLRDQSATLKVRDVVGLFTQLARGIDVAHGVGIIHRDIKPSNIIVTQPKCIPKIMDFGIARGRLDQTLLTQTDVTIGTPAYMAPELIRGDEVGPMADIYSFAQTIYFSLARAQPYTGTSTVALMYAKVHKQPTPLREHNPLWPVELDRILYHALHKQPEKRPQSAVELTRQIEDSLSDLLDYPFAHFFTDASTAQTLVVPLPVEGQPAAIRRWVIAGVLAVCVMLFVPLLAYWAFFRSEDTQVVEGNSTAAIVSQSTLPDTATDQESLIDQDEEIQTQTAAGAAPSILENTDSPVADSPSVANNDGEIEASPQNVGMDVANTATDESPSISDEQGVQSRSADGELAMILSARYDWSGELRGPPRELELTMIDNVMLNQVRLSVFREDMDQLNQTLVHADTESRLRFVALIEALLRDHQEIKLHYTRQSAQVDGRFALIEFQTGLTGKRRMSDNAGEETLLPRFNLKAAFQKQGRDWQIIGWPHFSIPQ